MMKKKRLIPMIAALLAVITAVSVIFASAAYLGDANLDGKVQANDARKILRHAARIDFISDEAALALCDIDGNGKVNASDARLALRMASKAQPLVEVTETTEQAELYWVLVGSGYTLNQVVNDGDHHYTPSYGGVVDGMELIWYDGGFYGSGPSHCKRGYMCSIPPEYVAQTGTISLTLRIVTEEFDVGGKEDAAVWCPGTGVQLLDGWNKIPLTDENGEDELYTGSGNNRPYVHGNVDISKTFSCTLPPNGRPADDFRAGDKITLRWSCGGGTYEWTYELKESAL